MDASGYSILTLDSRATSDSSTKYRSFLAEPLASVDASAESLVTASSLTSVSGSERDGVVPKTLWKEDQNCAVCAKALGKMNFNPRHHCRICGSSVCSACSTSTIKVDQRVCDLEGAQRACDTCAAGTLEVKPLKKRVAALEAALEHERGLREALEERMATAKFVDDASSDEGVPQEPTSFQSVVPPQCLSGHLLSGKASSGRAWRSKLCSKCCRKLTKGMFRLSCKPCKYHLCETCVTNPADAGGSATAANTLMLTGDASESD